MPIPQFPPECFGLLRSQDLTKQKQFQKGLQQLEEEGVMQVFYSPDHVRREPVLAAVGELQFDVVASRLESEYGVKTIVERMPFVLARWVTGDPDVIARIYWPQDTRRLVDREASNGDALRLRTATFLLHERICLPQVSVARGNRETRKLIGPWPRDERSFFSRASRPPNQPDRRARRARVRSSRLSELRASDRSFLPYLALHPSQSMAQASLFTVS